MKFATCIVLLSLVLVLSGCATTGTSVSEKAFKTEIERLNKEKASLTTERDTYKQETAQIKTQMTTLQDSLAQEKQKTVELEAKMEALSVELQSLGGVAVTGETPQVAVDELTKKIQLALYAAGFDPGKIDGKMGPQTIQAIKNFQEAKGLKADGIVGKETWEKLQGYLEMK